MTSTEEGAGAERGRRLQPCASFRIRDYRWLWAANVCHSLALATQGFAFAWLIIETLDENYSYDRFSLTLAIPAMLLGLLAGVLSDRRDRRLLLLASYAAVSVVFLLTAMLVGSGGVSLGMVVVMAFLLGAGVAVGEPVRLALVPTLVPANRLLNANALNEFGRAIGYAAGPVLAGVLVSSWGTASAFAVPAIAMGAGVLFLLPLRVPPRESSPLPREGQGAAGRSLLATIGSDIAECLGFIKSRKATIGVLLGLLLSTALVGPWLALTPAVTRDQLDVGVRAVSFLYLFLGIGALLSVVTLAFIPRLRNAGGWYGAMLTTGVVLAVAIWFSPAYVLTALLMTLYGLTLGFRGTLFLTLLQSHTSLVFMGRVMGVYTALLAVGAVLGPRVAAAGQALLDDGGWIVFAAIVLAGVTAFVLVRSPSLRRMPSHPEPAVAEPGGTEAGWRRSDPLG